MKKPLIIITICLFCSSLAIAGWFGPKTYEDCITESMKGVTSNVSARAIIKACREKFPIQKKKLPPTTPLIIVQISKITGNCNLWWVISFQGTLYNEKSLQPN